MRTSFVLARCRARLVRSISWAEAAKVWIKISNGITPPPHHLNPHEDPEFHPRPCCLYAGHARKMVRLSSRSRVQLYAGSRQPALTPPYAGAVGGAAPASASSCGRAASPRVGSPAAFSPAVSVAAGRVAGAIPALRAAPHSAAKACSAAWEQKRDDCGGAAWHGTAAAVAALALALAAAAR